MKFVETFRMVVDMQGVFPPTLIINGQLPIPPMAELR